MNASHKNLTMKNLHKLLPAIMAGLAALPASAQSLYPEQIKSIESNNAALRALSATADATALDARTGLSLPNPEVSVAYLFGSGHELPNETDVEVTQGFDFATLSGAKSRVSKADVGVARASLRASRAEIMLQAEKALIEYSYCRAMVREMERQNERLQTMFAAAGKALESGAINQLDYNKIELETLSVGNELKMARVNLDAARRAVESLNGGAAMELPEDWPQAQLPSDFESWLSEASARSGALEVMRANLEKSRADVNLRRKEGLPEFSVGYIGQIVKDGTYHGAGVTLSLPLWGNRGRVKAAKALEVAGELELESAEQQFRLEKQAQYERALQLQRACADMDALYNRIKDSNEAYLRMALDKGTITVLEYLTAQEDFSTHYKNYLESRRDFLQARALLYAETL